MEVRRGGGPGNDDGEERRYTSYRFYKGDESFEVREYE